MGIVPNRPGPLVPMPPAGGPPVRGAFPQEELHALTFRIADSILHHPAPSEAPLTLRELRQVNALQGEDIALFKEALTTQELSIKKSLGKNADPAALEKGKKQLEELAHLRALIPKFTEHQALVDKANRAWEEVPDVDVNERDFSLILPPLSRSMPSLVEWGKWVHTNRQEECFCKTFHEELSGSFYLENRIDDHYQVAESEWRYLRNNPDPSSKDYLFQVDCLRTATAQAQEEISKLTAPLQELIDLFGAIPSPSSDEVKILNRLISRQEALQQQEKSYASLSQKVTLLAPSEELVYSSLSSEAREAKRRELVAARPPVERGFLGRLWHNITHPDEWSERTKSVLGVGLRVLQLSAEAINVYQKAERFQQITEKENDAAYLKEVYAALPPEKWQETLSQVDEEVKALLSHLNPSARVGGEAAVAEPLPVLNPLQEQLVREGLDRYGREGLTEPIREKMVEKYAWERLVNLTQEIYKSPEQQVPAEAPSTHMVAQPPFQATVPHPLPSTAVKTAQAVAPLFALQQALSEQRRALGLEESNQCFDLRDAEGMVMEAFTIDREALEAYVATDARGRTAEINT